MSSDPILSTAARDGNSQMLVLSELPMDLVYIFMDYPSLQQSHFRFYSIVALNLDALLDSVTL